MGQTTALEKNATRAGMVQSVINIGIAAICAFSIGYGFFYDTRQTQKDNTTKIVEHENEINEVKKVQTEAAITIGAINSEINSLGKNQDEIKKQLDRLEDKLDKLIMYQNR